MYPIRFEPVYQDYIWGGKKIASKYHRKAPSSKHAESWEISDREEGMSVVANGEWKGLTLRELNQRLGAQLVGEGKAADRFPLLFKIIDAAENLSIQVHPNEETAALLKGEPKTEMWIALEPSVVYAGLKAGVSEKELLAAIRSKKAEDCLEKIELKPGEVIYIPGGRVHAICGGSFLYEIQQNSNTTYRLYDWGRVDAEGKSRPLHLKEAMAAINWNDQKGAKLPPRHIESDLHHQLFSLADSPFFTVCRADIFDRWHLPALKRSCQILFFTEGSGQISVDNNPESFSAGMTFLIPAAADSISIDGRCQALWTWIRS